MECSEKLVASGAVFMILFWLMVVVHPFNTIIITALSMVLLLASWIAPGMTSEVLDGCDLVFWVIGGFIGLGAVMPLLFYIAGGVPG